VGFQEYLGVLCADGDDVISGDTVGVEELGMER